MSRFQDASKDVKTYVAITGITGLAQAIANTILLAILGVDFPITWGVLFFFFNFIPAFGFLLALIPQLIVTFLESGWKLALAVGSIIGNQRDSEAEHLLYPCFFRKESCLHGYTPQG